MSKVKVYKFVVIVVDHDDIGYEQAAEYLEETKYPNWCMSPMVASVDEREIEWSDDHPLNKEGWEEAADELFNKE